MFKPIRMLILAALAFIAGVLFERQNATERCTAAGGTVTDGLCRRDG
ncbi:MAG: hypothetical protein AAGF27_00505 [Pseudomonadota bacterium]